MPDPEFVKDLNTGLGKSGFSRARAAQVQAQRSALAASSAATIRSKALDKSASETIPCRDRQLGSYGRYLARDHGRIRALIRRASAARNDVVLTKPGKLPESRRPSNSISRTD